MNGDYASMIYVCFPEGHVPEIIEAAQLLADLGAYTPIVWRRRGHLLPTEGQGIKVECFDSSVEYENYCLALRMVDTGIAQIFLAGAELPKNRLLPIVFRECGANKARSVFSLAHVEWRTEPRKQEFCLLDPCVIENPRVSVLADLIQRAIPFAAQVLDTNDIHTCLLAHSTGSTNRRSMRKQTMVIEALRRRGVKGVLAYPMQLDAALDADNRDFKVGCIGGQPNLLVFPDLTSANLVYKAIELFANESALLSGAILCGVRRGAVGILPRSPTVDLILRAVQRLVPVVRLLTDAE